MRRLGIALAASVLLAASSAFAQIVTLTIVGTVNTFRPFAEFDALGIEFGTPVVSYLSYDASTPDSDPGDPNWGLYESAITDWVVYVGPWTATLTDTTQQNKIFVINGPVDQWQASYDFDGFTDEPDVLDGTGFRILWRDGIGIDITSDSIVLPDGLRPTGFHFRTVPGTQIDVTVSSVTVDAPGLPDGDGDGRPDIIDNCPDEPNFGQADADLDLIGDVCDSFPDEADHEKAQCFVDLDACEPVPAFVDSDGDGEEDSTDRCPDTPIAIVDEAGCSLTQFCRAISASTSEGVRICNASDWRNDEPTTSPDDCVARKLPKKRGRGVICTPAQ